jgi:predicted GNAT family N-acyltransferase
MQIEFFGVSDAGPMRRALEIRRRVFVDEQGVPLAEEIDEHDLADPEAVHALALEGDRALGTGRFYPLDRERVQIGRMAVLAEVRGAGIGGRLLAALAAEAARRGYRTGCLLAQLAAIPLYERAGFRPAGGAEARVWDGGILHQPMEGPLTPAPGAV